jgi:flagellar hook protein FlgE
MSLLGSLNAAVGGMNAESTALNAISDNVANSQTVGFKATNTDFVNYVTDASATSHQAGAVVALPNYTNSQQGAITQVSSPTSLAVSGAGFFAVQLPTGNPSTGAASTGASTFSPTSYYTQVGNFAPNAAGYLMNSAGYALDGWPPINAAATTFNTNSLGPIQISQAPSPPVATSEVTLAANLPATPTVDTYTTPYTSTIPINDAFGNTQNLQLSWSQVGSVTPGAAISTPGNPAIPNRWDLTISGGAPIATATPTTTLKVMFGSTPATAGTILSIGAGTTAGGITPSVPAAASQATGDAATITLPLVFGAGNQQVTLNLGTFGASNGITQFAGSDYAVATQTQNGSAQGNYSSVTIKPTGDVVINYDNGTTSTVAKIPLVNFNNPDALQQQDGQAFTTTLASGNPNVVPVGTGGTGTLVVGAVEGSNVDIATEFTQMIVAQQAYSANSKMITTANQMMTTTINMVQ